ncbi:MAG: FecR family protein [Woeseiaceae bacterium]|nr:FecR family protein [Woeseiaceae bacterium]
MSNVDHDHLEELLRRAPPRPVPAPEDEAAVREAVQREWQAVTGTRRSRRRITSYALAATVLLVVFVGLDSFRTQTSAPMQVGTIARNNGPVYLLGEGSELRETNDLANVVVGQTIVTGEDAGLAIVWQNGGSLRVDENTRLSFTGTEEVRLATGRVYFDSESHPMQAAVVATRPRSLLLKTEHGDVRHIGTQYMARADQRSLVVSVREGQVDVQGRYHSRMASSGEQVTFAGSLQPSVLSIGRSGGDWAWIEQTTPVANVEGRTLHQFLEWACRELGLELEYSGNAERRARDDALALQGETEKQLSEELAFRVASYDLYWSIEEGILYISDQAP